MNGLGTFTAAPAIQERCIQNFLFIIQSVTDLAVCCPGARQALWDTPSNTLAFPQRDSRTLRYPHGAGAGPEWADHFSLNWRVCLTLTHTPEIACLTRARRYRINKDRFFGPWCRVSPPKGLEMCVCTPLCTCVLYFKVMSVGDWVLHVLAYSSMCNRLKRKPRTYALFRALHSLRIREQPGRHFQLYWKEWGNTHWH